MIAVAGAGIGGLVLAVALQERGVEVLVLEAEDQVRASGAGISLWPNAMAALDVVGLGDLVRSVGHPVSTAALRLPGGALAGTVSSEQFEAALGGHLVCVDRGELVQALAGRLSPGTVRTASPVTGFTAGAASVDVLLTEGRRVEAQALAGADGFRSAVAVALAGPLPPAYSGYTAWRGIADLGIEDGMWACLFDGHEVGWLPVPGDRTYWFATASLPEAHELPGGDGAYLGALLERCPDPVPGLLAATPDDRLLRTDVMDRAVPRRWGRGLVTLLGDAAHPMRPHLGQGGCQAIEDAVVLAQHLAGGDDPVAALRRYEDRRVRRAMWVRRLSTWATMTAPAGIRSRALDGATRLMRDRSAAAALRLVAPVTSYRAGRAAVTVPDAG